LRYFSICSMLASATLPIASASSTPRSPHDRPSRAWNEEKSRRVADAWFEEQRAAGLTTEVDASGSTLVGADAEDYAGIGADPAAAFGESSEAAFPEEELGRATRKLGSRLSDISKDIDMWAQGYRMLGVFIDCSHSKHEHHSQDDDEGQYGTQPCGRWMMWAAYYNRSYRGGGWQEYYGGKSTNHTGGNSNYFSSSDDDFDSSAPTLSPTLSPTFGANDDQNDAYNLDDYAGANNGGNNTDDAYKGDDAYRRNLQEDGRDIDYSEHYSTLDCHKLDTSWKLLGVYRMEFYQFIEQLSKHLWDIDSYEYGTVTSGMDYMTDSDCTYVGDDADGEPLYAAPHPKQYGYFVMGMYTDKRCVQYTGKYDYDDFDAGEDRRRRLSGNDDNNNGDYDNESTLTNLNAILNSFKMCRLCIDYPTYQDGYFIGNGTDDGSLINQCWKFHSHDSFPCTTDCIFLGHMQGTIMKVTYGDVVFGGKTDFKPSYSIRSRSEAFSGIFMWSAFIIFFGMLVTVYASVQEPETASHKTKRSNFLTDAKDKVEKKRSRRSQKTQGKTNERRAMESRKSEKKRSQRSQRSQQAQSEAEETIVIDSDVYVSDIELDSVDMNAWASPKRADAQTYVPPVLARETRPPSRTSLLPPNRPPVLPPREGAGAAAWADPPVDGPRGAADLLSASLVPAGNVRDHGGQSRNGDPPLPLHPRGPVDRHSSADDRSSTGDIRGTHASASHPRLPLHPRGTVDLLSSVDDLSPMGDTRGMNALGSHPRLPLHPRGTVDLLSSTVPLPSTMDIRENNRQIRSTDTDSVASPTGTVDILSTLKKIQESNRKIRSTDTDSISSQAGTVDTLSTLKKIQESNRQIRSGDTDSIASSTGTVDIHSTLKDIQDNSEQRKNGQPELSASSSGTMDLLSLPNREAELVAPSGDTDLLSSAVNIQENNGPTRSGDTDSIASPTGTVDIHSTLRDIQSKNAKIRNLDTEPREGTLGSATGVGSQREFFTLGKCGTSGLLSALDDLRSDGERVRVGVAGGGRGADRGGVTDLLSSFDAVGNGRVSETAGPLPPGGESREADR